MEKQQTAVEWLEAKVDRMIQNGGDTDLLAVIEHIQQAKEIEMEQKVESYKNGYANGQMDAFNN
jgi:regulator of RNase E activity RraB